MPIAPPINAIRRLQISRPSPVPSDRPWMKSWLAIALKQNPDLVGRNANARVADLRR